MQLSKENQKHLNTIIHEHLNRIEIVLRCSILLFSG